MALKLPCYCASLRQATRAISQEYDRAMRPLNLTGTQFTLLRMLNELPSARVNDLAEAMKKAGVKVVLYQPYYNADASNQVAKRADGVAVEIATEVGGVSGTDDVFSKFDTLVSSVAGALSGKTGGQP